jgi:hypothetical protein
VDIKTKDSVNFRDLKILRSLTTDWELVYSCYSEVYRLYVKRDETSGFQAVALYNAHSDNTKASWENSEVKPLIADVIFTANACFDGTRQLVFNPCLNHPCLDRLSFLLRALRKIELETCPDADDIIAEHP